MTTFNILSLLKPTVVTTNSSFSTTTTMSRKSPAPHTTFASPAKTQSKTIVPPAACLPESPALRPARPSSSSFASPTPYQGQRIVSCSSSRPHKDVMDDYEESVNNIVININLDFPEQNREVQVYTFENLRNPRSGDIINGFQIVIPADVRDVASNLYRAEIVGENEILLQMPSLPFSMLHDSVKRHALLTALDIGCPRCQEAQDIVVNDVQLTPARAVRKILLRFPENIVLANLSSSVNPVLANEEEQPYIFEARFGATSKPIKSIGCNMTWKVASIDRHRQVAGSASKDSAAKLTEMFSRMSTFAATTDD